MSANNCSICGSPHHLALVHSHWPLNALWFPPYGNLGAQAAPAGHGSPESFEAALKSHEDKVAEVIGNLDEAERAIAYKYLHAAGLRIATVDQGLRKAIRAELERK